MNNKVSNYFFLMEYLNNSDGRSLESEIARFLFENREELKGKSLSKIAEEGYFSKASVSRFFKNNGVQNFNDYNISNAKVMTWYGNFYHDISLRNKDKNIPAIQHDVTNKMKHAVEQINEIPEDKIAETVKTLKESRRIIFIGSQLSLSQMYGLQSLLVYDGRNAYAPQDYDAQQFLSVNVGEGDTVIVISVKGRWYHSSPFASYKEEMFANKAKKVLWTAVQKHDEEDRFDQVLHFGNADNEFAYAQLMAFVPVIMNAYITKCLKAEEIM